MNNKIRKKRGLDSEGARRVRQQGHDDALEFALSIGLDADYQNDAKAKKQLFSKQQKDVNKKAFESFDF